MKDAYKVSKDNNKKTGRSPRFCAHFDDFDEILGTRDFMNPPFATQVSLNEKSQVSLNGKTMLMIKQQQGTKVKSVLVSLTRYSWCCN